MRSHRILVMLILAGLLVSPQRVFAEAPPENGKYVEYYPGLNKRIYQITWRKDGQVVRRRVYHENGKLKQDIIYRDGTRIFERNYYENGRLQNCWSEKSQEFCAYYKNGLLKTKKSTNPQGIFKDNAPRSLIFDD